MDNRPTWEYDSPANWQRGGKQRGVVLNRARSEPYSPDVEAELPSDWRELGSCKGMDASLFFPDGESEKFKEQITAAKAICGGCQVRDDCEAAGMHEEYGIWGGLTETERRAMKGYVLKNPKKVRHRVTPEAPKASPIDVLMAGANVLVE